MKTILLNIFLWGLCLSILGSVAWVFADMVIKAFAQLQDPDAPETMEPPIYESGQPYDSPVYAWALKENGVINPWWIFPERVYAENESALRHDMKPEIVKVEIKEIQ